MSWHTSARPWTTWAEQLLATYDGSVKALWTSGKASASAEHLDFGVLGPVEVGSGSTSVEIRRGIPRPPLSALIVRAGETVSPDWLAGECPLGWWDLRAA